MRICLVNEYFPPFAPGGAEWSTEALARALADSGHDVTVITPNWGAAHRQSRDGFTIVRFPFPIKLVPGRRTAPAKWLANRLFYWYAAAAIWWIARRRGAEVIHVQNKHTLIPGTRAARALGVPVVLTIRDGSIIDAAPMCLHAADARPPDCGFRKLWRECSEDYFKAYGAGHNRLRTKLAFWYFWRDSVFRQRFLLKVDCVVGVSDGILDIYRRSGLLRDVPQMTVYNLPPRPESATQSEVEALRRELRLHGHRVVLYVGKRSIGKGTPDLQRAIEKLIPRVPDAVFVFVGDGTQLADAPHIRSLTARPNRDVLALYPLADVVVVPSVIPEALNRVIVEAMAAGCPVVATRVGGNAELVKPGETGFLVERKNPDELAEAIERVLGDRDLRARLGEGARHRVEQLLDPRASVRDLVALYQKLVAAPTRA